LPSPLGGCFSGGATRPAILGGRGGAGPLDEKSGLILEERGMLYLYREYNSSGRYKKFRPGS